MAHDSMSETAERGAWRQIVFIESGGTEPFMLTDDEPPAAAPFADISAHTPSP